MYTCEIPLREFFQRLVESGRIHNYSLVITLVAREADCPKVFRNIKRNWISLDDLTNENVIFILSGNIDVGKSELYSITNHNYTLERYQLRSNVVTTNITPHVIPVNTDLINMNTGISYSKFSGGSHSRQITELRKLLLISESEVPCLYVQNLYSGKSIILPILDSGAYKTVKKILELCIPIFDMINLYNNKVKIDTKTKKKRLRRNSLRDKWRKNFCINGLISPGSILLIDKYLKYIDNILKSPSIEYDHIKLCHEIKACIRNTIPKDEYRKIVPKIQSDIDLKAKTLNECALHSNPNLLTRQQELSEIIKLLDNTLQTLEDAYQKRISSQSILTALELKPKIFGIGVDLKKLFELSRRFVKGR